MPTYQFEAMDATGQEIKDVIEAPSEEEAQQTIRQMGYFVTKLTAAGGITTLDEVRALGFQFAAAHVSVSHAWVHMVDFGLPVKVGGLWVKPGDLIHADQHGVVNIPADLAEKIPAAVAKVEADERKIIEVCQARDFSADRLKELYKQIRPGTY